jgi:hypothetical protein
MVFLILVAQLIAPMMPGVPQAVAMIAVAYILRESKPKDRKRKKRSKK